MPYTLWTREDLLATLTDPRMDSVPTYARDTFFKGRHYSADREIRIDELPQDYRYSAPFVHWSDRGRPINYDLGSKAKWMMPAYIKLKNSINIEMLLKPQITEYFRGAQQLSMQDRYDLEAAKIIRIHKRAIDVRKERMAWEALRFATQTVEYAVEQGTPYPSATIDFDRAANLTVLKGANYWDNAATSIYDDLQDWYTRMESAVRGGAPNQMIVGSLVAPNFRKNTQIREMMHADTSSGQATAFNRAMTKIPYQGLYYIGTLEFGLDVWGYNEFYSAPNGTATPFLDPKEIMLLAPGYEGVEANGAIFDMDAISGGGVSAEVYPKMWRDPDGDGQADWIMHQASPLMIPLYPNRSFRARVLAP